MSPSATPTPFRRRVARWLGAAAVGLCLGGAAHVGAGALDDVEAGDVPHVAPDTVRTPVLLVPGWFDEAQDLEPLRRRFIDAGWRPREVVALGFQDPVGSNRAHALEIAGAVEALRRATGAPEVDVVAHSMGGLALRLYLAEGVGAARVRRAVFLGTPQRGTLTAYVAWGQGGREMEPGSEFLDLLNDGRPLPSGVQAVTVRTPIDTRVVPGESATLPGVPDLEVCCPTHQDLVADAETFLVVHGFLMGPGGGVPASP